MPLDPFIIDPILSTFKNMIEDCKQKNITGENFDAMCKYYARMEELGQQTEDINVFSGAAMQENLYGKFSDHYSRALGALAKQEYASGAKTYDDAALLKTSLDALKQAIQRLHDNYKEMLRMASDEYQQEMNEKSLDYAGRTHKEFFASSGGIEGFKKRDKQANKETKKRLPNAFNNVVEVETTQNPAPLIAGIQKVIDLGEQPGISFPSFLRLQIETGVDKAMEGTAVMRDGLVYQLELSEASPGNPYYPELCKRKLEAFDLLAKGNKFGVPDLKELGFLHQDIDYEFDPPIKKWDAINNLQENLLWDLYFWSLSYCKFAPYIVPWSQADNPVEATISTQQTRPGVFKEHEKLMQKYFGLSFMDLFKYPIIAYQVEQNYFEYSQVFTDFMIEELYSQCKPFNRLPDAIIEKRASFYPYPDKKAGRELNPNLHLPAEKFRVFYNKKFGEGHYETKYDPIVKNDAVIAEAWDWGSFKYK